MTTILEAAIREGGLLVWIRKHPQEWTEGVSRTLKRARLVHIHGEEWVRANERFIDPPGDTPTERLTERFEAAETMARLESLPH